MEALRRDLTTLPVFTSPATNVTDLLAQYQNDLDGLLEIHAPLKRRVVTLRPPRHGIMKLRLQSVKGVNWRGTGEKPN